MRYKEYKGFKGYRRYKEYKGFKGYMRYKEYKGFKGYKGSTEELYPIPLFHYLQLNFTLKVH